MSSSEPTLPHEGAGATDDAVSTPPSGASPQHRTPGQVDPVADEPQPEVPGSPEETAVEPGTTPLDPEPQPQPEPEVTAAAEPGSEPGREPEPVEAVTEEPVEAAEPAQPQESEPTTHTAAAVSSPSAMPDEHETRTDGPGAQPDSPETHTPAAGSPAADAGAAQAEAGAGSEPAPVQTTGGFEAYTIGAPGRAFTQTVSVTETKYRDAHDIVIDAATIPDPEGTHRLVLRAASSRGLAHQQYGDPRQDDHCVVLSRDGEWLVCLVADGVSSGEWSHLAAKMATEEGASLIISLLETHRPEDIPFREVFLRLGDLLADVCATLPDAEPTVDLTPKDVARRMATTLVAGIVATRPGEDGTHAVTVVRLGDTSAWILDAEDGWIPLGEVKNAGNVIAESATACLPLVPEADPVPVRTTLGADAALVLMTDGIGDPLGGGGGEVGRELARLWARPPHPVEFAAQIAFGRKTFDDDRGAVAVWLAVPE